MATLLVPASRLGDWKRLLTDPDRQWRRGDSARALACCWQAAGGLPVNVRAVLRKIEGFYQIEALIAVPEHQVPLPGGTRSSQNDVWVLARTPDDLVSMAVEGKVAGPFGPCVGEWLTGASAGKLERLEFLCGLLGLHFPPPPDICYQLLHRTASAVIEANRFHARHAVMLVHCFSRTNKGFSDYERFLYLFNCVAAADDAATAGRLGDMMLHFAWVRGDEKWIEA